MIASTVLPYPTWLNPGDNAWQLTAATLVGLMSVPGLVVLYGGVMQKRWSVNSMMLAFTAFAGVLIVWVLYAFDMGFGNPWHGFSHGSGRLLRQARTSSASRAPVLNHAKEQGQATIPLVGGPPWHFPQSSLVYFQFVFAAITPLLMLGSVLGRINFKAWLVFVPLWISGVYVVNAFLIWGGGWFAHKGALDFSGGYVIHLTAGVAGFVAAWVIGPRLARDREIDAPNNLLMVATGAGFLWLGWNGFNGGDPVLRRRRCSLGRPEHEPLHRGRPARLGRLGLHDRPQALADRHGQRDDRRPCRDHARGRVRQRLRRDHDRGDRLVDRLRRLQLHQPPAPVPERRRHARRHLHARVRRARRRPARRGLRRLAHGRLHQPGRDARASRATGSLHLLWVQFYVAHVGDLLHGDRDVHHPQAGRARRSRCG